MSNETYTTESELRKLELPLSHTSHSAYEQIPKHGRETTLDTNAVVATFPALAATLREAVRLLENHPNEYDLPHAGCQCNECLVMREVEAFLAAYHGVPNELS